MVPSTSHRIERKAVRASGEIEQAWNGHDEEPKQDEDRQRERAPELRSPSAPDSERSFPCADGRFKERMDLLLDEFRNRVLLLRR